MPGFRDMMRSVGRRIGSAYTRFPKTSYAVTGGLAALALAGGIYFSGIGRRGEEYPTIFYDTPHTPTRIEQMPLTDPLTGEIKGIAGLDIDSFIDVNRNGIQDPKEPRRRVYIMAGDFNPEARLNQLERSLSCGSYFLIDQRRKRGTTYPGTTEEPPRPTIKGILGEKVIEVDPADISVYPPKGKRCP